MGLLLQLNPFEVKAVFLHALILEIPMSYF